MNENLNLCKILKDCPKGTKLWSSVWGTVFLAEVEDCGYKPITLTANCCDCIAIHSSGKLFNIEDAECIVFPSKDQRDWSKFKVPIKRFDPKDFKPFDKVLLRDGNEWNWLPSFIDRVLKEPSGEYSAVELVTRCRWNMCIPYNDETKHLVGTSEDCDEYYKWWEE